MQTKSRRVLAMTTLAMAVAGVAAAFGPIRHQIDPPHTPIIRSLPAVQPIRLRIDPPGTPIIRDIAGWPPVRIGIDPGDPPVIRR